MANVLDICIREFDNFIVIKRQSIYPANKEDKG